MKYFFLFFVLITVTCYSQEKSMVIVLKSDSIITTNWIEFHEFSYIQKPHIVIHSYYGPKIKIEHIKNYKGYDQNGNYRQLDVSDVNTKNKFYYLERKLQTDLTKTSKIYFDELTYGITDNSRKTNTIKYSWNNNGIKKLNYRNVKNDLGNLSVKKLKKVNQIRIVQFVSMGIGTVLLVDVLRDNRNPTENGFMDKDSSLKFVAGGLLVIFPITLYRAKQDRLIEALRNEQ